MFHTQMKNGVTFLTAGALASDGIRHGFSTRLGGVSPAPWDSLNLDDRRGDDIANVQENFRRLCAALDIDVRRAVLSRQVHRDDVRLVTAAGLPARASGSPRTTTVPTPLSPTCPASRWWCSPPTAM